jgi:N-acetylmuramoyl-L-alanine amidase
VAKKVYLSPSTQENNIGTDNFGTEEQRMNIIADYMVQELQKYFDVRRNRPEMTLSQVIQDSNAWGADIHVAVHSNAGGGEGTEIWHYPGSINGKRLAECIYKQLAPLSPGKDRGVKSNNNFAELKKTKAVAVIIEVGFHDNVTDAEWIKSHPKQIADAINKGIFEYAGIKTQSNVHVLEFSKDHRLTIDSGIPGKLEPLSAIVKSRNALAGINFGFFDLAGKAEHYSLLMRGGKIENPPNHVMECWLTKDNKLVIQDIEHNDQVPLDAQWAAGLSFSLVVNGKKDIRKYEKFPHYRLKEPRTALGQKADGTFVLVVVDSPGMTADELADHMLSLGCINAINADGGGSSTMVCDGKVINKPEYGAERNIGTALLVYPPEEIPDWKQTVMQRIKDEGLINSPHDPDSNVTWAEMAAVICQILNKKSS